MTCPNCTQEYEDHIDTCPACGADHSGCEPEYEEEETE